MKKVIVIIISFLMFLLSDVDAKCIYTGIAFIRSDNSRYELVWNTRNNRVFYKKDGKCVYLDAIMSETIIEAYKKM